MAIEAVKDDVGLDLVDKVQEWLSVVEVNGLDQADYVVPKAVCRLRRHISHINISLLPAVSHQCVAVCPLA